MNPPATLAGAGGGGGGGGFASGAAVGGREVDLRGQRVALRAEIDRAIRKEGDKPTALHLRGTGSYRHDSRREEPGAATDSVTSRESDKANRAPFSGARFAFQDVKRRNAACVEQLVYRNTLVRQSSTS